LPEPHLPFTDAQLPLTVATDTPPMAAALAPCHWHTAEG
jgi:hypothetical protein